MKKIKLDPAKLQLKKETIVVLTDNEMRNVIGGDAPSGRISCVDTTATTASHPPACQTFNVTIGCAPSVACSDTCNPTQDQTGCNFTCIFGTCM